MTVREMLGGGARLVRTHPGALALWGLLYLAAIAAMMALVWPMMAELTEFQRRAMVAGASPPPPPPTGFFGGIILMEVLLVAAMVAIFAAAVRAVARGGTDRFGFLRLGMDEVRLVGLAILLWLIASVGMTVFILVGAIVTGLAYAAIGMGAFVLLVPLWLVFVALLIWVEVRLSLAAAFTVLRGRITIGPAWRATRGRFWTLLGGYLVIGLTYFLVSLVLTFILYPDLFGFYGAMLRQDQAEVLAAQQAMFADLLGPRMLVGMALGTVINTVLVGWLFGAVATAAVALDRPGEAAA